jgi:hypothetical protein
MLTGSQDMLHATCSEDKLTGQYGMLTRTEDISIDILNVSQAPKLCVYAPKIY